MARDLYGRYRRGEDPGHGTFGLARPSPSRDAVACAGCRLPLVKRDGIEMADGSFRHRECFAALQAAAREAADARRAAA